MTIPRIEEIQSEIDERITHAETGEQWAEICALEDELERIKKEGAVWDGVFAKLFGSR